MKVTKGTKVKVISAQAAQEFEDRLNEALDEVASKSSYSIHYNMSMGFCAYVEYTYTVKTPETLEDEYIIRGERYTCGQCPYFIPSMDGRSKYGACQYGICNKPIASDYACKHFYINHHNGTWKERG